MVSLLQEYSESFMGLRATTSLMVFWITFNFLCWSWSQQVLLSRDFEERRANCGVVCLNIGVLFVPCLLSILASALVAVLVATALQTEARYSPYFTTQGYFVFGGAVAAILIAVLSVHGILMWKYICITSSIYRQPPRDGDGCASNSCMRFTFWVNFLALVASVVGLFWDEDFNSV